MQNNYDEFKKFLNNIDKNNKPKLLLHTCCAPCSSYTLLFLKEYFDITIFYSNDNIYPYEEFELRLNEQIRFAKQYDVEVICEGYNNSDFNEAILGKEDLGERSIRCYECYKLRLKKTAIAASKYHFDYFTTSLSISPYKISKWINEIGQLLGKEYNVDFLYSDFKKEEGYKKSIQYSKEYNLYRQDYCGCIYSKREKV